MKQSSLLHTEASRPYPHTTIPALSTHRHHGPIHTPPSRPYPHTAITAISTHHHHALSAHRNHGPIHTTITALSTHHHHGPIHTPPSQPYPHCTHHTHCSHLGPSHCTHLDFSSAPSTLRAFTSPHNRKILGPPGSSATASRTSSHRAPPLTILLGPYGQGLDSWLTGIERSFRNSDHPTSPCPRPRAASRTLACPLRSGWSPLQQQPHAISAIRLAMRRRIK